MLPNLFFLLPKFGNNANFGNKKKHFLKFRVRVRVRDRVRIRVRVRVRARVRFKNLVTPIW